VNKLYIILINDNVIRSTLEELASRTQATYWLVTSPHYLARLSDRHRTIFSRVLEHGDFSVERLIETLAPELAAEPQAEVRFLTNDESCDDICVDLQEHFGGRPIWTHEQVLPCVNKLVSKRKLADTGLRLPRHVLFDKRRFEQERKAYIVEIADYVGWPLISKPIDRYASMDVKRHESLSEFLVWAAWCSSPKDRNTYEIDEFVDGELFNCDSLVQHGRIIWSNVCRNVNPCLQFAAGQPIGAVTLPAECVESVAIRALNRTVISALNPPDGATHLECFRTRSGELVFLELSARPPGGDLVGIYEYCFGFDMDVAHFMLRAGEPYQLDVRTPTRFGGWVIHPRRQGVVESIRVPAFESRSRVQLNVSVGEQIVAGSRHIVDEPAAEFWLYSDDYAQVERDSRALKDIQLCEMAA
jgi:biotin carboxylase